MLYSTKKKLDRRNSIMAAVRKELKANNAYVPPEALKALAEALDTSEYYDINVIRKPEDASSELIAYDDYDECFQTNTERWGKVVFGDAEIYDIYLDEGDVVFDVNGPFIALRGKSVDTPSDYQEEHWITIYSPESIIDEAQYTAQKDAELEELCQLR